MEGDRTGSVDKMSPSSSTSTGNGGGESNAIAIEFFFFFCDTCSSVASCSRCTSQASFETKAPLVGDHFASM